MHNIELSEIYRPSVWSSFGMLDQGGANYRACKNLGLLYGKKEGIKGNLNY